MLEIRGLNKTYITKGAPPVRALRDVSVKLEHTGMVFVLGKSGSGKSTFLNVVGGLDKYDSGEIIIKGKSSTSFRGSDFDSYRNTYLGFVFQEYNLINEFTIGQNIALALELQNRKATAFDVDEILRLVELDGLSDRMPLQISGGQRQRVAIARALIKNPEIIMADEPTGALDSATGASIFSTLQSLSKTRLVLIVSHDREFAERYGDRIIEFSDGQIVSDMIKKEDTFFEAVDTQVKQVEEIIEVTTKAGLSDEHLGILNELLKEKQAECASHKGGKRQKVSFSKTDESALNMSLDGQKPFNLIKSRLPQKNAFKMARSSMKHKKIRLVVSILLSVIAVTLFGFSSVVGGFNQSEVVKSLIRDNGYNYMVVSKSIEEEGGFFSSKNNGEVGFSAAERQRISAITGANAGKFVAINESLTLGSASNIDIDVNDNYYVRSYYGVVGIDDFEKMGLDVPAVYGRYPTKVDEILVPNYIAQSFLMYGMAYYDGTQELEFYPKQINDILSYSIYSKQLGRPLKIVGIINFDIERYAPFMLKSTKDKASKLLSTEFSERKNNSDIVYIYGTERLADIAMNRSGYNYANYSIKYHLPNIENSKQYVANSQRVFPVGTSQSDFLNNTFSSITYLGRDGSTTMPQLEKGQVIINLSQYAKAKAKVQGSYTWETKYVLNETQLAATANELGLFEGKMPIYSCERNLFSSGKHYKFYSGEFEVVGVLSAEENVYYSSGESIGIFNDDEFEEMVELSRREFLFVYLKDDRVASTFVSEFVGKFDSPFSGISNIYNFNLPFSDSIGSMQVMFDLLAQLFFWISMVMSVFAALLLLNFIGASISHKKKEIGILRAIGARKVDVMSIFLWEGILIAVIVLLISTVSVFAAIVLFNNLIGVMIGLPFTLLVFSIVPLLYMILLCFGTIALASIVPSRRVAALKPMDAIRSI